MVFTTSGSCRNILRKLMLLMLLLAGNLAASAQSEAFLSELKGNIAATNFCITADDKFNNVGVNWNDITNLSVDNVITFEIRLDTNLFYYNTPFECTVNFTVEYDTMPSQSSHISFTQSLTVKYDNTAASQYKGIALLKFKKGHWVKLTVNSISSPQFTTLPAIFRIKNEILIERKYAFSNTTADSTNWSILSGSSNGQVMLSWDPSRYAGAEMYDLEWTFIDKYSHIGNLIATNYSIGSNRFSVPADTLAKWMFNNATRVTVPAYSYQLNIPYDSGYVILRVRGVQINPEGFRLEGDWNYRAKNGSVLCSSLLGIVGHEPNLNWQYSSAFAEEGKKKEVISYFDGSLRSRQSVSLNNSDKVGIVGQSIYDEMGRPAVSVLPAPVNDTTLHYYRGFNKNASGNPYNYNNFIQDTSCIMLADAMNDNSGSSKYYSANNPFPQTYQSFANKFIPKAEGYPFTVAKFTGDNTGRIKSQGGVGPVFQLGTNRETKYFYGKPSQTELDRMFGSEAGDAIHYLKNMMLDANGQLNVTYTDARGKPIATALAGVNPPNLEQLKNEDMIRAGKTEVMLRPRDFFKSASDNSLTATSTFLVALPGNYHFTYQIDPLSLTDYYGPGKASKICSDCYYDVEVKVLNDCGVPVYTLRQNTVNVFDTACANDPVTIDSNFTVSNLPVGEYNVVYKIFVSGAALEFYTDNFISTNTDLLTAWDFVKEELKKMDLSGCYSDCKSCSKLGTKTSFVSIFENLLEEDSLTMDTDLETWLENVYDSLKLKCDSLNCASIAPPVCEQGLNAMIADVTPGGQYALLDTVIIKVCTVINGDTTCRDSVVYSIREYEISVLKHYTNSSLQFFNENNTPDTVVNSAGTRVLPNALTLTEFVNQWKDSWAMSLVPKHSEYCFYLWCLANERSFVFDDSLINVLDDADTAIAYGYFNPNTAVSGYYLALLEKDPFFRSTSPQGKGYLANLRDNMEDSLLLFSRTLYGTMFSDKNILQTIDRLLYCDKGGTDWTTCAPVDSCRSRDMEWAMYKNFYLNLKRAFYKQAMALDTSTTFNQCRNCFAGDDILPDTLPTIGDCPELRDFTLTIDCGQINGSEVAVVKVAYNHGGVRQKVTLRVGYYLEDNNVLIKKYADLVLNPGRPYVEQVFYTHPDSSFSGFYLMTAFCSPAMPVVDTTDVCPDAGSFSVTTESLGGGVYKIRVSHPSGPVSRKTVVLLDENCNAGPSGKHYLPYYHADFEVRFNAGDTVAFYNNYQPEGGMPCLLDVCEVYCPYEDNDTCDRRITFRKRYDSTFKPFQDMALAPNGGAIAVGYGIGHGTAARIDKHGNRLWSKYFAVGYSSALNIVKQTFDGGHIMVGNVNYKDISLIKLDANGNITWSRTILDIYAANISDVIQTSDSGYVICGATDTTYSVTKLSSTGLYQWSRGLIRVFRLTSIVEDGNYLVAAGHCMDWINTPVRPIVVKLNKSTGSVVWKKVWDAGSFDLFTDIYRNGKGYLLGMTQEVVTPPHAVVQLDTNGVLLSAKKIIASPSVGTGRIYPTLDGGYVLASNEVVGFHPIDSVNFLGEEDDLILTKVSNNNTVQWIRKYPLPYKQVAKRVYQKNDGSYLIIDNTWSAYGEDYGAEFLKTDDKGLLSGCSVQTIPGWLEDIEMDTVAFNRSDYSRTIVDSVLTVIVTSFTDTVYTYCQDSSCNVIPPALDSCPTNNQFAIAYNNSGTVCTAPGTEDVKVQYTGSLVFPSSKQVIVEFELLVKYDSATDYVHADYGTAVINSGTGFGTDCMPAYYSNLTHQFRLLRVTCKAIDSCSSGDTLTDFLYSIKRRVYSEYDDPRKLATQLIANAGELTQLGQYQAGQINALYCESMADSWMFSLSGCTNLITITGGIADSTKYHQLRTALIEVCKNGSDLTHPIGSSTVNPNGNYVYTSFKDAILNILGSTAINNLCSDDLLAAPYPYDKQPVLAQGIVTKTDSCTCAKLQAMQTQYNTAVTGGYTGTLHQYLQAQLGLGYTITETQLQDLQRSCNGCNYILKKPVPLPLAFDCRSNGPVNCTDVQQGVTAFNNKYPGIQPTDENYNTLFAVFLNHRFGYTLSFDDYQAFLDTCDINSNAKLYNKALTTGLKDDSISCIRGIYNTAVSNGYLRYYVYIDSVKRDFHVRYMTKCLNALATLTLSDSLFEYHYTLYYYDRAGNLVKTIPPAGVKLLTDLEVLDVKNHRAKQTDGCYAASNNIVLNDDGDISYPLTTHFEGGEFTIEANLKLTSFDDQLILSKSEDVQITPFPFANWVYRGFVLDLANNQLSFSLSGVAPGNVQHGISAYSTQGINTFVSTNDWFHLAIVRTADGANPIKIYINGAAIPLTMYGSLPFSADAHATTAPLMVGAENISSVVYLGGKLTGTMKNLRIYNRPLTPYNILQNAFSVCQLPADNTGMIFWSPMSSATSNLVPEQVMGVNGTLTGGTWVASTGVLPQHTLATTYQYNTLNQIVRQHTPDADSSWFWYDRVGRLVVSQNSEQHDIILPDDGRSSRFSYTIYDSLSRVVEVGEKTDPDSLMTNAISKNDKSLGFWYASGIDRQVTYTVYDEVSTAHASMVNNTAITNNQRNLRKRVVTTYFKRLKSNTYYNIATHYTYDISGNAHTVWQDVYDMRTLTGGGVKRLEYDYDFISGKVNKLSYQKDQGDQFFYKYMYNAENRVIRSLTSRDGLVWINDVSYNYYLHGPLARTELGQYKIQGLDYAYTLQGWLKGVNSTGINSQYDMGRDAFLYGSAGEQRPTTGRDVFGFMLHYYGDSATGLKDYKTIAESQSGFANPFTEAFVKVGTADYRPLYNGNISGMAVNLSNLFQPLYYNYRYDQLNRLMGMDAYSGFDDNTNAWSSTLTKRVDWKERLEYDGNGNILKYLRNGNTQVWPNHANMDSLNYQYNRDGNGRLVNNRLNHIRDAVIAGNYSIDIDNQSSVNYAYDKIGNLVADGAEGISGIVWTVYGKIDSIYRNDGRKIIYQYDAIGSRISKKVTGGGLNYTQYYIRDPQGNTLGVYRDSAGNYEWQEQHLYGSSRLGAWEWSEALPASAPNATGNNRIQDSLLIGSRKYELTNHLDNVLGTISDKKTGVSFDGGSTTAYCIAEIINQQDYAPFGMQLTGRLWHGWSNANKRYRYGFNGKENDEEVKGVEGSQQDYGMRIFDPRVGRFLSVDPLTKGYPMLTPYQFASNRPIDGVDLDGLEWESTGKYFNPATGRYQIDYKVTLSLNNEKNIYHLATHKAQLQKAEAYAEETLSKRDAIGTFWDPIMNVDIIFTEGKGSLNVAFFEAATITRLNSKTGEFETIKNESFAGKVDKVGETQTNFVYVPLSNTFTTIGEGMPSISKTFPRTEEEQARSFSHELGHTAGLVHPWDPGTIKDVSNVQGLAPVGNPSLVLENLMNSPGNPVKILNPSELGLKQGRQLTSSQREKIEETVQSQQPKKN